MAIVPLSELAVQRHTRQRGCGRCGLGRADRCRCLGPGRASRRCCCWCRRCRRCHRRRRGCRCRRRRWHNPFGRRHRGHEAATEHCRRRRRARRGGRLPKRAVGRNHAAGRGRRGSLGRLFATRGTAADGARGDDRHPGGRRRKRRSRRSRRSRCGRRGGRGHARRIEPQLLGAHSAVGAGPDLARIRIRRQLRPHDMRRDLQHDLGLLVVAVVVREQAPKHRQLPKPRNLVGRVPILILDQAAENLGLAVLEPQRRRRIAGADLVSERAQAGLRVAARNDLGDVADLEAHLDADIVVPVHLGLDLQLDADIQVLDRLRIDRAAGARHAGARDHGHLVADQDLGLLLVARADARARQQVRVGIGQLEIGRHRQPAGRELIDRQVMQRAPRACRGRRPEREAVRPVDAQIGEPVARHLQHLDFQHHLRLGQILRGDHPLGHADGLGRRPDRHGIGPFVGDDLLDLQKILQQRVDVLGVRVGQLERAHLEVLVFLLLGRRGRIDEHRVGVEHLLRELVLQQDHVDRVFERGIRDEDRGLQIDAHIAIEDDAQARRARQRFEHHAHVGIPELQRHRLAHDRRRGVLLFGGLLLQTPLLADLAVEAQCAGIVRILREHTLDALGRAIIRAALHHPLRFLEHGAVAPVHIDGGGDAPAALVARIQPQGLQEQDLGPVEIVDEAQPVRPVEQVLDLAVALFHVLELELRVGRLPLAGGLQLLDVPGGGAPADQDHSHGPRQTAVRRGGASIEERWAAVRFKRRTRTAGRFHLVPLALNGHHLPLVERQVGKARFRGRDRFESVHPVDHIPGRNDQEPVPAADEHLRLGRLRIEHAEVHERQRRRARRRRRQP
ncbi:hypothetical protein GO305_05025 [Ralstonia solanacearum]|nr:hypothetical protein [Ralstonia solanacearum]